MFTAAVIFALTYLVLGLQRLPKLHIGRPAGALLGAVAMVAFGVLSFEDAKRAIDLDTILFLLGMMIVLAYLNLRGSLTCSSGGSSASRAARGGSCSWWSPRRGSSRRSS